MQGVISKNGIGGMGGYIECKGWPDLRKWENNDNKKEGGDA